MIKEKLIIKNFAGFDHIEIDLKPINIFIGPQAAGKSVIIKLVYFFKSYIYDLGGGAYQVLGAEKFNKQQISYFLKYFPPISWGNKVFEIEYYQSNSFIKVKREENSISFSFSQDLIELNSTLNIELESIKKRQRDKLEVNLSKESILEKLKKSFLDKQDIQNSMQVFIPAGRSFFSNVKNNIFSIVQGDNTLDPFLVNFGSFYEIAKDEIDRAVENNSFFNLYNQIIQGQYTKIKDEDFLTLKDGRTVSLRNASSGQQEAFPLLSFLYFVNFIQFSISLHIEEPEAHLYPDAQKKIVQLLAQVYNTQNKQLFITTHSPYILASFNNLIEAGNIIKTKPGSADKVYKIIPKEEVLSIDDLIAYSIKDGKKEILLDKENNLISQNILDDVSNDISKEFNALLDIEFGE